MRTILTLVALLSLACGPSDFDWTDKVDCHSPVRLSLDSTTEHCALGAVESTPSPGVVLCSWHCVPWYEPSLHGACTPGRDVVAGFGGVSRVVDGVEKTVMVVQSVEVSAGACP